jgi:hypothetical protein
MVSSNAPGHQELAVKTCIGGQARTLRESMAREVKVRARGTALTQVRCLSGTGADDRALASRPSWQYDRRL